MTVSGQFRSLAERLAVDLRTLGRSRTETVQHIIHTLRRVSHEVPDRDHYSPTLMAIEGGLPLRTAIGSDHVPDWTQFRVRNGYLHFTSDRSGAWYGERILGPIRDRLHPEQIEAVRNFTKWSRPFNNIRDGDPNSFFQELAAAKSAFDDLAPLTGLNPVPTLRQLISISTRPDVTERQRHLIAKLAANPDSNGGLDKIWMYEFLSRRMQIHFEGPANFSTAGRWIATMDSAVERAIPGSIHASRTLRSIDHLIDIDGMALGSEITTERLQSLIGSVQTDRGYMSCSLGKHVTPDGPGKYWLELDIPENSLGLYVGERSAFPNQNELILARHTSYSISDVQGTLDSGIAIHGEVISRSGR
ncbi:ADP-ribosyltransferase [Nocardia sp. NPDC004568]|uniref:ADP-ribosyltransferase n=1 Tax=Nocardia sp. NPDC004568 TaxID=3154551 RepID=UPI0033B24F02